jgi:hypothetical protein
MSYGVVNAGAPKVIPVAGVAVVVVVKEGRPKAEVVVADATG